MLVPAAADAKVPKGFFGISAQLPDQRDFEGMQQAGLGTYRFGASWRGVQSTRKGPYTWGGFDASVREAANHGMQPVPVLFGTRGSCTRRRARSTRRRARRTSSSGIVSWPLAATAPEASSGRRTRSSAGSRSAPGSSGTSRTRSHIGIRALIRASTPGSSRSPTIALSGVDPGARIVLGGIFGYPQASSSISASRFLTKLYRVGGIKRHFEAINLHPYGSGVATVRKQVSQARSALHKAKDSRAEIVIGEMGWASSGPARSPRSSADGARRGGSARASTC